MLDDRNLEPLTEGNFRPETWRKEILKTKSEIPRLTALEKYIISEVIQLKTLPVNCVSLLRVPVWIPSPTLPVSAS
jgi:hypothetical protein